MPIMNKLTASYLAGIIDGEGCLDIRKMKNDRRYYSARLRVGMVDKEFIEWLRNSFGGSIYCRKQNGNNRTSYTWQVDAKMTMKILEKIYPYLRLKKKQAEIVMKFWKTKKYIIVPNKRIINPHNKVHKELLPEIRKKRDSLYWQLRSLQIKGKNAAGEETERENPSGMRQSDTLGTKQEITV